MLIVPSTRLKTSPFIIRETFAAGVPVVASDSGGMAEMVRARRQNGLLFAPGTYVMLASELKRASAGRALLLERLARGIPRR